MLLREIIRQLKQTHGTGGLNPAVAVTASTGLAAYNIEGTTLHSFGGIVPGYTNWDDMYKRLNAVAKARWKSVKVLIIDESQWLCPHLDHRIAHEIISQYR